MSIEKKIAYLSLGLIAGGAITALWFQSATGVKIFIIGSVIFLISGISRMLRECR